MLSSKPMLLGHRSLPRTNLSPCCCRALSNPRFHWCPWYRAPSDALANPRCRVPLEPRSPSSFCCRIPLDPCCRDPLDPCRSPTDPNCRDPSNPCCRLLSNLRCLTPSAETAKVGAVFFYLRDRTVVQPSSTTFETLLRSWSLRLHKFFPPKKKP